MPRLEALVGTSNWYAARRGHLTASRMADVMAKTKAGKFTAEREKYLMEIVAERMSDVAVEHFVTDAMRWGSEKEPDAIRCFEERTGVLCNASGFYVHDEIEFFGATPDREIGRWGLAEVKCPTTTTYVNWLRAGVVPEQHIPQMTAQLAVTKRKWCDFIAYDPRVVVGVPLFVRRFEPSADAIRECEEAAREFLAQVEAVFQAVTEAKG